MATTNIIHVSITHVREGAVSDLSPVISGVPQDTVLGPVLFLHHISDIGRGVSEKTTLSSYVDDTRVKRVVQEPLQDCIELQQDLQQVYKWANEVNMTFNSDKFESVRFWPKGNVADFKYLAPDQPPIQEK